MPHEDRSARDRLRAPIAWVITAQWLAAGVAAILQRDAQVFFIATGPFGILTGYLFAGDLVNRAQRNGP